VKDRLLELIQTWAEEFQTHPESQIAVTTYEDLRRAGMLTLVFSFTVRVLD